jgi:hypothetical protein
MQHVTQILEDSEEKSSKVDFSHFTTDQKPEFVDHVTTSFDLFQTWLFFSSTNG